MVLAGPIALVRYWLRPEPWDARHLRVQFESVRYERAGLVFTYCLENRTRRSESLLPGADLLQLKGVHRRSMHVLAPTPFPASQPTH